MSNLHRLYLLIVSRTSSANLTRDTRSYIIITLMLKINSTKMELLSQKEVQTVIEKVNSNTKVLKWTLDDYSENVIGYTGDHLKLAVEVETNGLKSELKFFVKCMPRFVKWKIDYLKEMPFFEKEFVMLSRLFKEFEINHAQIKWRPKLLFVREDLFIFEDVAEMGYKMPCHLNVMSHDEIVATVTALAVFHAQSIIYEEKKTKELNRPYRLYEDFSEYLQEPPKGQGWRDDGRDAVIDFLKVYSKHRSKPNFRKSLEVAIPKLFEEATNLMKPSPQYRNVVIHRDLWTNNIFFKKQENGELRTLIIDFQTVLYCPPMLDLSSMLFFNTTREFREKNTPDIIELYYEVCNKELKANDIDIDMVFDKATLYESYEQSITFGITQAAITIPVVTRPRKINVESRSQEYIELAKEEHVYRKRLIELFDELVERFVLPTTD